MGIETAILGSAIIGGGLSYLGSQEQASASESAAQLQAAGGDAALEFQMKQYADLVPWRDYGEQGLQDLTEVSQLYVDAMNDPSSYKKSPDYEFNLSSGLEGLGRYYSSIGKGDSGEAGKGYIDYAMNTASSGYGGYLGRLEALMNRYAGNAGIGQTANTQSQGIASSVSDIYQNQATTLASGEINQANARTGLYQNLSNIGSNATNQYMLNNYLQNSGGSTMNPFA